MVHDPLGILDALMIAVSGFFIVFLMLAVLWGIIVMAIVSHETGIPLDELVFKSIKAV